jgi:hypothetical protein
VGVRTFRKHLGWYVEGGGRPEAPEARRDWKSRLCRLDTAREIKAELGALWSEGRLAA